MSYFGAFISTWAEQRPEQIAIEFENESIAWSRFNKRVLSLHAHLIRLGIQRGDRIAWLGLNHPGMLVLLFAAARLGAMLLPLNYRLTSHEHREQLAGATPVMLVADSHYFDAATSLRDCAAGQVVECNDLEIQASGIGVAEPTGEFSDDLLLVYTSGTTGKAKGAVLTQNALLWNAMNSIHAHDLTSADRVLMALPMFHVGGLNIMLTPALFVGATVAIQASFDAGAYLAAIQSFRPTLSLLVPATVSAVIGHERWMATDVSSLRLINTGSSIVPVPLLQAWQSRGVPAAQVYGSTETAPIAIYLRAEDTARKLGSAGLAAMHCQARLINDRGQHCAIDEVGEIQVKGANVMRCYWQNEAATREVFDGDWFKTGDLARLDADGYFWVVGRSKDMIISGGENIYPAEIESLIAEQGAVAQCAVVGIDNERWGEVPVLAIVLKNVSGAATSPASKFDLKWMATILEGKLAKYKWPRNICVLDDLPKTALGKVRKDALRKIIEARN